MKNRNLIYKKLENLEFTLTNLRRIVNTQEPIETYKVTSCDFFDTKGAHCAVPGSQPCCADCGCILNLKVRSLSAHCPKNKWAAFMSKDMEEELKNNIK